MDWRQILAAEADVLVDEAAKKWIAKAITKPGSLRRSLGVMCC